MTISAGSRIGRYAVLRALGAGGMGEIWLARDETLGRNVAVKVLPGEFERDPERLARWEREARILASLNHPNIATVYGIEPAGGSHVLALELVEGQTLAERIAEGPMPVREALPVFRQIAAALEAAHEAGIVHRDLKPSNVMITPAGRVKVLDFGLAKPFAGAADAASDQTPTLTERETEAGVILGTAAYMSPEQARGRVVDRRTDIWAFGCTLFEALSGRSPFAGATPSDTLARILEREPDGASLPAATPPLVRQLLRRCLKKDAAERLRDMGDARLLVEEAIAEASAPQEQPTPPPEPAKRFASRAALWTVAGVALGLAASFLWRSLLPGKDRSGIGPPSAPASLVSFTIDTPPGMGLAVYASASLAFSRDGKRLAMALQGREGGGLYIRRLEALDATMVPGTDRARNPFFYPGDDWIGFEAGGRLLRVAASGGAPQPLCELPYPAGATATGPGTSVVLVPSYTGGLYELAGPGTLPRRLATPRKEKGEGAYIWPAALPEGRGVLFAIWKGGRSHDEDSIAVLARGEPEPRIVLEGGYNPRYARGTLFFVRGGEILAAPFDLERLSATGRAVPVASGVLADPGSGAAQYDVSPEGTLAFVPGGVRAPLRRVVFVDRTGATQVVTEAARAYAAPRLSPDGRRLALWTEEVESNVWTYDLARGTLSRIGSSADDHSPMWSPDGKRLAYESGREGIHHVFVFEEDGTERRVTSGDHHHYLGDWSPDGRWLVYTEFHPETGSDLWAADPSGTQPPRPVVRTRSSVREPAVSRDGRWIAYASDESGRFEIYAQPFPGPGERTQVSAGGGEEPAWSRDGRELFYRAGNRMMAVSVRTDPTLEVGRPAGLFTGSFHDNLVPARNYDTAPDGRFLMVTEPTGEELPQEIRVVLGLPDDLARRAPAP